MNKSSSGEETPAIANGWEQYAALLGSRVLRTDDEAPTWSLSINSEMTYDRITLYRGAYPWVQIGMKRKPCSGKPRTSWYNRPLDHAARCWLPRVEKEYGRERTNGREFVKPVQLMREVKAGVPRSAPSPIHHSQKTLPLEMKYLKVSGVGEAVGSKRNTLPVRQIAGPSDMCPLDGLRCLHVQRAGGPQFLGPVEPGPLQVEDDGPVGPGNRFRGRSNLLLVWI
ncbi:hypothetical protein AAG570_009762 [Ranatra chinensis]|uniref:Uncharacterized protein n=1 Tax=Ranatra chinensis TaxID=642074 RepID=A0ABD0Z302_9HEMI